MQFIYKDVVIMKFISDKMSIETIKKKKRTHAHTHNTISVNKTPSSHLYVVPSLVNPSTSSNFYYYTL